MFFHAFVMNMTITIHKIAKFGNKIGHFILNFMQTAQMILMLVRALSGNVYVPLTAFNLKCRMQVNTPLE